MGSHTTGTRFNPQKYVNLIIAVAGALGSAVFALGTTSGHLSTAGIVNLAIAGVGAFNVWYVTETADNPKGKAVIAFITAGLIAAQSALATGGHLRIGEWLQILMAAITATGLLGTNTTAALRKALPASYANNTYVVDAGTPQARTEYRPIQTVVVPMPTVTVDTPSVPRPNDDANVVVETPTVPAPVVNVIPPAPFIGGVPLADGNS
jgi:hypothetical protein